MSGVTLDQGEGATSVACLIVKTYTEQPLALGSFVIHWSRYAFFHTYIKTVLIKIMANQSKTLLGSSCMLDMKTSLLCIST